VLTPSRKATFMEVKIGVQNVAREITIESNDSAADVAAAVSSALEKGTVLVLTDDHGRQVVVPAAVLGYVQIGESEKRGVGFGNL
jgi:Protein of unknown function (DUF3107)